MESDETRDNDVEYYAVLPDAMVRYFARRGLHQDSITRVYDPATVMADQSPVPYEAIRKKLMLWLDNGLPEIAASLIVSDVPEEEWEKRIAETMRNPSFVDWYVQDQMGDRPTERQRAFRTALESGRLPEGYRDNLLAAEQYALTLARDL